MWISDAAIDGLIAAGGAERGLCMHAATTLLSSRAYYVSGALFDAWYSFGTT